MGLVFFLHAKKTCLFFFIHNPKNLWEGIFFPLPKGQKTGDSFEKDNYFLYPEQISDFFKGNSEI